jgi:hypothetical protein
MKQVAALTLSLSTLSPVMAAGKTDETLNRLMRTTG